MIRLEGVVADRYEIIRQVSTNSLAYSFLANDLSSGNLVVIRVAREKTELAICAHENEAEVLSSVAHQNVVKLISSGHLNDNRPYLILKWITGVSIEEHLASKQLSVSQCLEVITAIAKALEAVHSAGFIHRDIKPANIIIPQERQYLALANATLIDFGSVGKLKRSTGSTSSGEMFGTPYYMSPEQLLALPQCTTTDFYALGALLYEMLYQRPPFIGKSTRDVFENILTQDAKLTYLPNSSPELFRFITRCLHKNPNKRPRCAHKLVGELKELQSICGGRSLGKTRLAHIECVYVPQQMMGGMRTELVGIIAGIAIAFGGIGGGFALHRWLGNMLPDATKGAIEFQTDANSREFLTETLAERFHTLTQDNKDAFAQALGITLQLLLKEYEEGKNSGDRLGALSAAISTAEKLEKYTSPWYVRYEKVIASIVSMLGIITGLTGIIVNAIRLRSKWPTEITDGTRNRD